MGHCAICKKGLGTFEGYEDGDGEYCKKCYHDKEREASKKNINPNNKNLWILITSMMVFILYLFLTFSPNYTYKETAKYFIIAVIFFILSVYRFFKYFKEKRINKQQNI